MLGVILKLFRTQCEKPLINIISLKAAFLKFFLVIKRTIFHKRNQRHKEPQILCGFVDARASPSAGFCVTPDTTEVQTQSIHENRFPLTYLRRSRPRSTSRALTPNTEELSVSSLCLATEKLWPLGIGNSLPQL